MKTRIKRGKYLLIVLTDKKGIRLVLKESVMLLSLNKGGWRTSIQRLNYLIRADQCEILIELCDFFYNSLCIKQELELEGLTLRLSEEASNSRFSHKLEIILPDENEVYTVFLYRSELCDLAIALMSIC